MITKKLGVSQRTVMKTIKRFEYQKDFRSRTRCGRPKSTTMRMDIAIVKAAKFRPRASSSAIRARIPDLPSGKTSTRTIRRRLFDAGLKCYRSA